VRIPRGRATVKIAAESATMQKPGDLPRRCLQLSNASRQGVQAVMGILFPEKIPSPACYPRVTERSTGFCLLRATNILLDAICVALCVSVVNLCLGEFTTETQSATEEAQRDARILRFSSFSPC
jgi:hypothetical protein